MQTLTGPSTNTELQKKYLIHGSGYIKAELLWQKWGRNSKQGSQEWTLRSTTEESSVAKVHIYRSVRKFLPPLDFLSFFVTV